jgi:copper chaperone CopZ
MESVHFNVGGLYCYECSMALKKFLGSIKGIVSVDVENEEVVISYQPEEIDGTEVERITRESIEKLGYRVID